MYMSPHDTPNISMPVNSVEKILAVAQVYSIEPEAAHGYRMMMYGDEYMVVRLTGERVLEKLQMVGCKASGIVQTHSRIEHNEAPVFVDGMTAKSEGRYVQYFRHDTWGVMIAWHTVYRRTHITHYVTKSFVASTGFILHKIAGGNYSIRTASAVVNAFDYCRKGFVSIYTTHHGIALRVQMRVGEMEYADRFSRHC